MVGKITSNKKPSCSKLSAIMGHSPWQTRNEVYKEIRGYIAGKRIHGKAMKPQAGGIALKRQSSRKAVSG
tara:strand:+ start:954 stop:1163 length:210 start_codon:yes stop_codon:yes gene_type:complete